MDVNARSRTSTWCAHNVWYERHRPSYYYKREREPLYGVCVPVNIANKYSISKFNIYDFHFNLWLCWCTVIFLYSPFQQPGQPVFFCRCCCFDSIRYEYEFFICPMCARVRTVCLALFLLFCAVYTDVYCCLLFVLHGFIILTHFLRATQFSSVFFLCNCCRLLSIANELLFFLSAYIFKRRLFDFSWGERKKCFFVHEFISIRYAEMHVIHARLACQSTVPRFDVCFASHPAQMKQHVHNYCNTLFNFVNDWFDKLKNKYRHHVNRHCHSVTFYNAQSRRTQTQHNKRSFKCSNQPLIWFHS